MHYKQIHKGPERTPGHEARAVACSIALSRGGTTILIDSLGALVSVEALATTDVVAGVVTGVGAGVSMALSSSGNPKSSPSPSRSKLGCNTEKSVPTENRSPRLAAEGGGLEREGRGGAVNGPDGFEGLEATA